MNPFYTYSSIFVFATLMYLLNWSYLYPPMTTYLFVFIIVTVMVSLFLGSRLKLENKLEFDGASSNENSQKIFRAIKILVIIYIFDFAYAKTIPLIKILYGINYDYNNFNGIPLLHKLVITLNGFLSTTLFYYYVKTKKKKYIRNYALLFLPAILMYNRGMLLYIATSSVFIMLFNKKRVFSAKKIMYLILIVILCMYIFGLLGNIRIQAQVNNAIDCFDSSLILKVGAASREFNNSNVPKPFFWGYIYTSSPLANFQSMLNLHAFDKIEVVNFAKLISLEMFPDFISEYFIKGYSMQRVNVNLIRHDLTVGTVYARSVGYLGYLGPIVMYIYTCLFIYSYIILLGKHNELYIVGLSLLNTVIVFNIFSNMFVYSALSFQLIYPIIFGKRFALIKRRYRNKYSLASKIKENES